MAHSEQGKPTRLNHYWTKKRSGIAAPISIEDLMEKEVQLSTRDGAIRELSVLADSTNKQSTKIKQKIRILDHPKKIIEVLCARLAIENRSQVTTPQRDPISTVSPGPFLTGKHCAFWIASGNCFNLNLVMNHVFSYFGPKECLSK